MQISNLSSLNWRFRDASKKCWLPAQVPGCVHTDLLAAGQIEDPFYGTNELELIWIEDSVWEYQTEFDLSEDFIVEEQIELCADGLDTVATVYLNGHQIATTENMYVAHRWQVGSLLKPGRNELSIRFDPVSDYIRTHSADFTPPRNFNAATGGTSVRIRKQPCQFGWDWGPRLVTAGIWQDIRLEAWSSTRLRGFKVDQTHEVSGAVALAVAPNFLGSVRGVTYHVLLALDGEAVVRAEGKGKRSTELVVKQPQLWWPAGQGAQPLYTLTLIALAPDGSELARQSKRIGLRTIRLDRSPDEWGESFRFVVNGRPIFIKGANWIPADSFVNRLDRAAYARDLESAKLAHMNCMRVWGGGIYESEDFYDLCDELGLLVWQDFMFACNLVPSDLAFLKNVKVEAEQQVARLRDRACLGLWCGNNEIVMLNLEDLNASPKLKRGYIKLFHELLPQAVEQFGGQTGYLPSSEWRGGFENGHALGEERGDTHFWDVWHARKPVKEYEKYKFRFCSEFGMQSYSSPATNATFAPKGANVFGDIMENHQKNIGGNQVILDYVSRRYRFPKSQDDLIWLSQLNQAYCMQVGVEHYRRIAPRCMGSIYWQLNDCWPVASWSSIEYTGRWKALHYAARRFHAPALVSALVPGDEFIAVGNYRHSSVNEVHLYSVYDAPDSTKGLLRWDLFHLDGRRLLSGKKQVALRYGESVRQKTLKLEKSIQEYGRDHVYLRIALDVEGELASQQTVFLTPPRFIELPEGGAQVSIDLLSKTEAKLSVCSKVFQHAFTYDFEGLDFIGDDNGFDLYPDELRTVTIRFKQQVTLAKLKAALCDRSLVDSY